MIGSACPLALLLSLTAAAAADPVLLQYKAGSTVVREYADRIDIASVPPQQASVPLPGRAWPPMSLDETGSLTVGRVQIDTASGIARLAPPARPHALRYAYGLTVTAQGDSLVFERGKARCRLSSRAFGLMKGRTADESLRYNNLQIASSDSKVMALATFLGANKEDTRYTVGEVDVKRCRFGATTKLGNPDLLVELGWSRHGGWWIAGSIEQTLMRSADGRRWKTLALPDEVFSIVSAYAVNDQEIWLAGGLAGTPNPYLLTYTTDGGKSWKAVQRNDPAIGKTPPAWLEGIRRLAEFDPAAAD